MMKTATWTIRVALILGVALGLALPSSAQALTYDVDTNPGWFAANAWGVNPPPYDTTWTSGDSGIINAVASSTGTAINFDQDTNVTNLTLNGVARLGSEGTHTLTMSGGDITVTNLTWGSYMEHGVTIQGDYTKKGDGWLRINGSLRVSAYNGTATLQQGTVSFGTLSAILGASSHIVVAGATTQFLQSNGNMGSLTLNSGSVNLGRGNTSSNDFTLTVASLSGTGGIIRTIAWSTTPSTTLVRTLTVNQVTNTTFSGEIEGVNQGARIILNKQGGGDLALAGVITLARQTSVSGGRLYVNGSTTSFSDEIGSTAISVTNGATMGGTGTIGVGEDDHVVLGEDGRLAAGLEGAAGRTTYALDGGTLNLSAATAGTNTAWLKFDLGSAATAGTTYDQILLTGGQLNIGTGLEFDAFDFTLLSGFAPGTYVLFETPDTIIGSLGAALTDELNGYESTLSISGNNLVLTVIPEPGSIALLLAGAALLAARRRR